MENIFPSDMFRADFLRILIYFMTNCTPLLLWGNLMRHKKRIGRKYVEIIFCFKTINYH